jgi:NADP-dependent aldehyde dehydrogenase
MSAGFRTFNPSQNTWNTEEYFPTSEAALAEKLNTLSLAQSIYGKLSAESRAEFLAAIHASLEQRKKQVRTFYQKESGLSNPRFETEWKRTLTTIQLFEKHLRNQYTFEKTEEFPSDLIRIQKVTLPIGPVLVLGSSNFPLAYSTAGGDTIAAFAAGCCVLVKAHAMHAGTSVQVAECIEEARKTVNLPEGVFTHVLDDGFQHAQRLCLDERIQAIGFTGSFKGGKALMDLAYSRKNPIPVFAEMGSVNPVVIDENLSSKQQETVAEKLAHSICNDAGQFCTKPGVIFIPYGQTGEHFTERLKQFIAETIAVPMLHPNIHGNFENGKTEIASISGVKFTSASIPQNGIEGRWALAETDVNTFIEHQRLQKEVFGPFSLLVTYNSKEELHAGLEALSGQLTGSIFYETHSDLVTDCIEMLSRKVGRIILNDVPTGVRVTETMHHGGPFPASSDVRFTAVGPDSIQRFQKYVSIQQKNRT